MMEDLLHLWIPLVIHLQSTQASEYSKILCNPLWVPGHWSTALITDSGLHSETGTSALCQKNASSFVNIQSSFPNVGEFLEQPLKSDADGSSERRQTVLSDLHSCGDFAQVTPPCSTCLVWLVLLRRRTNLQILKKNICVTAAAYARCKPAPPQTYFSRLSIYNHSWPKKVMACT